MKSTHVLLYIPNIIGYFRMFLLIIAWYHFHKPTVFLTLHITQALLDAIDGWSARKFNQVSKFGAWLDVIVDNIGRAMIWTKVSSIGIFISSIEWIAFAALNSHGHDWKLKLSSNNDLVVRNVMKNGFQTPFGFLAVVLGIHSLPIIIYSLEYQVLSNMCVLCLHTVGTVCIIGRIFSLYCEIYVICLFINENLLK